MTVESGSSYEEIINQIKDETQRLHTLLDQCPYRWIINGKVYCSKEKRYITLNNHCFDCPVFEQLSDSNH